MQSIDLAKDVGAEYAQMNDLEKTESMLNRVLNLIDTYKQDNKYWLHFKQQAADMRQGKGPISDAQYLLHCNVYYLRELFEDCEDQVGLNILEQLEVDCF